LDKFGSKPSQPEPVEVIEPEILMTRDEEWHDSLDELDDKERFQEIRRGIDLATTLERIEKNFVITDPRLPDNPIVRKADKQDCFFIRFTVKLNKSQCLTDFCFR
jgi:hypothetical protein